LPSGGEAAIDDALGVARCQLGYRGRSVNDRACASPNF